PEVQIRADKETRYEAIGRVMYAIQRGGIGKVGFLTEPDHGIGGYRGQGASVMEMSVSIYAEDTYCGINNTQLIDVRLVLKVSIIVSLTIMTHAVKPDLKNVTYPPL